MCDKVLSPWLLREDAVMQALALLSPIQDCESCLVSDALGRVAADDVIAPVNVPPQDNSAMDGYALLAENSGNATLTIKGEIFAGPSDKTLSVSAGEAVRIMTGAPIPQGANAVVMQENTSREGHTLRVTEAVHSGENIRQAGSDIQSGSCVIASGTRLQASHLMLLASMGMASVRVVRKLNVGLIATGDELVQAGEHCKTGQIFESNRTGVKALLAPLNVAIHDFGIVRDDKNALMHVFHEASNSCDIIISSGGVSVGDADFVKDIVASMGDISFWKIAVKPGKPFAFGRVGEAFFCGLPGNPVSAYLTTQKLVFPIIRCLQGEKVAQGSDLRIQATLKTDIQRRPGREDFQRAVVSRTDSGGYQVTPLNKQSSGVMTTMTQANCYLIIPHDISSLHSGDTVEVEPFTLFTDWSRT